jgi:carbamoyltransferase
MRVLGISAFYHDSAAALLSDGEIVAAAQEERFTRKKHDPGYPREAIAFCLREAGISLKDVDYFVFYEKPFIKFERLLETYLAYAPEGFFSFRKSMPLWIQEKIFQKGILIKQLKREAPEVDWEKRLLFSEHHLSHAASAFYPSPFEEAAVLTMDGVGEWTTTSLALGRGAGLELHREIHFPHSIGLLYSAFTYYLGFKVNSGEYKVMGLAPYGEPKYTSLILEKLIHLKDDGSFRLHLEYFDFCAGLRMTNEKFARLFGKPARKSDEPLTQDHMDLAASLQQVTEEVVLRLARSIRKETGAKNLCLAGGVALNCVANGKVLREKIFDGIWIQPAAGDAGGALGAALAAYHLQLKQPRKVQAGDAMKGAYLGPSFEESDIEARLRKVGARFKKVSHDEMVKLCVEALSAEKALGWFQSRMEFGPRALGSRSILADARSRNMQSTLNLKIKYRESFRPFAPIVLRDKVSEWFEIDTDSPYMLLVAPVKEKRQIRPTKAQESLFGIEKLKVPRSDVPAVTHVDYSARIQTVKLETHARLHQLLKEFEAKTGCPVLVNTSFNVRGEPIVCSPEDAFRCFMGTEMDVLAVENFVLYKEDQDPALKQDYKSKFELD